MLQRGASCASVPRTTAMRLIQVGIVAFALLQGLSQVQGFLPLPLGTGAASPMKWSHDEGRLLPCSGFEVVRHASTVDPPASVPSATDGRSARQSGQALAGSDGKPGHLGRNRLNRVKAELRAYRALLARAVEMLPDQQGMASHSGTWNIELPAGEDGPVAYESPAFSLGADFRFRLIATITPGEDGGGRRIRRVGVYLRYLGQTGVGEADGVVPASGDDEDDDDEGQQPPVMTELAVPTVQCRARRADRPRSPWLSSQPIAFADPTAFECGLDDFARLPTGKAAGPPMVLRLAFTVTLLSVHFPSRPEVEELRSRAWEVVQAAVEEALTGGQD